jgi:hypothetical protein
MKKIMKHCFRKEKEDFLRLKGNNISSMSQALNQL